jgi:phosphoribosylglycinamide formyltransferase 2
LANKSATTYSIEGLDAALAQPRTDVRVFGKPSIRPYRRMAVALVHDAIGSSIDRVRKEAMDVASKISVV